MTSFTMEDVVKSRCFKIRQTKNRISGIKFLVNRSKDVVKRAKRYQGVTIFVITVQSPIKRKRLKRMLLIELEWDG